MEIAGCLWKRGSGKRFLFGRKTWRKRYFVLEAGGQTPSLSYYADEAHVVNYAPLGSYALPRPAAARRLDDAEAKRLGAKIHAHGDGVFFEVVDADGAPHILYAADGITADHWLDAISKIGAAASDESGASDGAGSFGAEYLSEDEEIDAELEKLIELRSKGAIDDVAFAKARATLFGEVVEEEEERPPTPPRDPHADLRRSAQRSGYGRGAAMAFSRVLDPENRRNRASVRMPTADAPSEPSDEDHSVVSEPKHPAPPDHRLGDLRAKAKEKGYGRGAALVFNLEDGLNRPAPRRRSPSPPPPPEPEPEAPEVAEEEPEPEPDVLDDDAPCTWSVERLTGFLVARGIATDGREPSDLVEAVSARVAAGEIEGALEEAVVEAPAEDAVAEEPPPRSRAPTASSPPSASAKKPFLRRKPAPAANADDRPENWSDARLRSSFKAAGGDAKGLDRAALVAAVEAAMATPKRRRISPRKRAPKPRPQTQSRRPAAASSTKASKSPTRRPKDPAHMSVKEMRLLLKAVGDKRSYFEKSDLIAASRIALKKQKEDAELVKAQKAKAEASLRWYEKRSHTPEDAAKRRARERRAKETYDHVEAERRAASQIGYLDEAGLRKALAREKAQVFAAEQRILGRLEMIASKEKELYDRERDDEELAAYENWRENRQAEELDEAPPAAAAPLDPPAPKKHFWHRATRQAIVESSHAHVEVKSRLTRHRVEAPPRAAAPSPRKPAPEVHAEPVVSPVSGGFTSSGPAGALDVFVDGAWRPRRAALLRNRNGAAMLATDGGHFAFDASGAVELGDEKAELLLTRTFGTKPLKIRAADATERAASAAGAGKPNRAAPSKRCRSFERGAACVFPNNLGEKFEAGLAESRGVYRAGGRPRWRRPWPAVPTKPARPWPRGGILEMSDGGYGCETRGGPRLSPRPRRRRSLKWRSGKRRRRATRRTWSRRVRPPSPSGRISAAAPSWRSRRARRPRRPGAALGS